MIDEISDGTSQKYSAWPDRLYLVGKNGKVVYAGGQGPKGFKPDQLAEAIESVLEDGKKK